MKVLKYEWAKTTGKMAHELFPRELPMTLKWSRIWEYPWVKSQIDDMDNIDILDVGKTPEGYMDYVLEDIEEYNIDTNDIGQHGDVNATIIGDIKDRKLFKNKYDCIMSISTIEHDEDPLECIKSMLSYLNDGGRIILTMDFCDGDNYTIQKDKLNEIMDFLEIKDWYKDSLEKDVIRSEDFCAYNNLRVLGVVIEK